MKTSFRNDYGRFAHPKVLEAIYKYGQELNDPYGLDLHSALAAELLKKEFDAPQAAVHFLPGGTATNLVFLSYLLRAYEAVICCDSGHIAVHETGAIEGSGHKVLVTPNKDGKITVEGIKALLRAHTDEHMVLPKAIYISDSTESGTIYHKDELVALRKVCDENGLYLYLDGARLGVALTSKDNDVSPKDLGKLCDAFYVGGGKNGLGIGEALIIVNPALQANFRHHIKNKGAMLAKGYLLGIEFEAGFRDGLYWELGKKANEMAASLIEILKKAGYRPDDSPTNQVFCAFSNELAGAIVEEFGCEVWRKEGERTILRFVTSYATTQEDLAKLEAFLNA